MVIYILYNMVMYNRPNPKTPITIWLDGGCLFVGVLRPR